MRRTVALVAATAVALVAAAPASPQSASVAALQVALRANGLYAGAVDGIAGPATKGGLAALQRREGLAVDGKVGPATRRALGRLGRPLLGQRELWPGLSGWDVAALEFRLRAYGLPRAAVDGRFRPGTAKALRRFQRAHGLTADGIAGRLTFRALARGARRAARPPRPTATHVVRPGEGFIGIARVYGIVPARLARANGLTLASVIVPGQRLRVPGVAARVATRASAPDRIRHVVQEGESFYSIALRFGVSPWRLARENGLSLAATIVPGQRLVLPAGASAGSPSLPADRAAVRAAIDRWSLEYGVDPKLARALAWMESGFQQHVVSSAGAVGVMQLLPETWEWVDTMLLGVRTPRTYAGNVQAGVRYLRWQLDQFGWDRRLALAGYYQGARAVRERGLFDDTKQYVDVILRLYGSV